MPFMSAPALFLLLSTIILPTKMWATLIHPLPRGAKVGESPPFDHTPRPWTSAELYKTTTTRTEALGSFSLDQSHGGEFAEYSPH